MRSKLAKYAPPGYDYTFDKNFYFVGLGLATSFSFSYLLRFGEAKSSLYIYDLEGKKLKVGAIMPDFTELFQGSLWGYWVLAFAMLLFIALRYASYYQHSKSIYLMKRLPDRLDMHRRCIIVPVIAAISCTVIAFLVLLLCFGHYLIFTPDACFTPGQWAKIWR